jgi:phage terminase large subunit
MREGSRSSKTYSLCQLMIIYCLQNNNKVVSVIRKTFPALRATVLRDFIEILKEIGLYKQESITRVSTSTPLLMDL